MAAADEELIRSFVVGLGFRNDQASERRFTGAIEGATLKSNLLATAIEGMVTRVAAAMSETGKQLSGLGFIADISKGTIQQIAGLETAFIKMGRSSEQADSFFLGIQKSARQFNDQTSSTFAQFGINVDKTTGKVVLNLRKGQEELQRYKNNSAGMAQVAAQIGLSPEDAQMIQEHGAQIQGFMEDRAKANEALGESAANIDKSTAAMRALIDVQNDLDVEWNTLISTAGAPLTQRLEELHKWMIDNAPAFNEWFAKQTENFSKFVDTTGAATHILERAAAGLPQKPEELSQLRQADEDVKANERAFREQFGPKGATPENTPTYFSRKPSWLPEWLTRGFTENLNYPPGQPTVPVDRPVDPSGGRGTRGQREGGESSQRPWWSPGRWFGGEADMPTPQSGAKEAETGGHGDFVIPGQQQGATELLQGGVPVRSGNPLAVRIEAIDPTVGGMGGIGGGEGAWGHGGIGGAPSGIRARGAGGMPQGKEADLAKQGYDYWRGQGLDDEQALSMLGNQRGENQLGSLNDAGGSGQFQWDARRRAQILAGTGIDVHDAPYLDQQKAARWEMEHSPDPQNRIWGRYKAAHTQDEQMGLLVHNYERSLRQDNDIAIREGYADRYRKLHFGRPAKSSLPRPRRVVLSRSRPTSDQASPAGTPSSTRRRLRTRRPRSTRAHPDWMQHYRSGDAPDVSARDTGYRFASAYGAGMPDVTHHNYDSRDQSTTHNNNQRVNVTVNGVSDPHEAAAAVGSTLDKVFAPPQSKTMMLSRALA